MQTSLVPSMAIILMFHRQFLLPRPCMRQLFLSVCDLCTIDSCLFLQNVGLVSQARPFPFHSANCFQYLYPICDGTMRQKGSDLRKSQVGKISSVFKQCLNWSRRHWMNDALKEYVKAKPEKLFICCCASSLWAHSRDTSPQTVGDLYQQKRPSFLLGQVNGQCSYLEGMG